MNSLELVESFSEFKELKSIDKQTMQHVLEDVFRAMLKKKFNTDEHIDVIVNIDKGDVQIFVNKEIVADGEVEDPNTEIAYSDAIKIEPDFEIGEGIGSVSHVWLLIRKNTTTCRHPAAAGDAPRW